MVNAQRIEPEPERRERARLFLVEEQARERMVRIAEEQIRRERVASQLNVCGWLILMVDAITIMFVPIDQRQGGHLVLWLAVAYGVVGMVMVGIAIAMRKHLAEEVQPKGPVSASEESEGQEIR